MIETIPNNAGKVIIYYRPFYAVICSVGKEPFHGQIDIKYKPGSVLLEFESFERWLKTLAMQEFTIESLARLVFGTLRAVLGDIWLSVTVHAQTTVHAPVSATIESEVQNE